LTRPGARKDHRDYCGNSISKLDLHRLSLLLIAVAHAAEALKSASDLSAFAAQWQCGGVELFHLTKQRTTSMLSYNSRPTLHGILCIAGLAVILTGSQAQAQYRPQPGEMTILDVRSGGCVAPVSQPNQPAVPATVRPRGQNGPRPQLPAGSQEPFAWGVYDNGLNWNTAIGTVETDLGFRRGGTWEAYATNQNPWGWKLILWTGIGNYVDVLEPTGQLPGKGPANTSLTTHTQTAGLTFDPNATVAPPTMHLVESRYQYDPANCFDTARWTLLSRGHLTVNLDTIATGSLIGVWATNEGYDSNGQWVAVNDPQWFFLALEGF